MSAPAWIVEAQTLEASRRALFTGPLATLNRQFERGIITVDEFIDQCNRVRADIFRGEG